MITRPQKMPRLLVALIASMTALAVSSQEAAVRPQLVVGIVIDGLDSQYIDLLRSHFGAGGFNRLLRQSVVLANADYGTNVDATAATAMLMTGASPSTTTITGAERYDRETMRCTPMLLDTKSVGHYTAETLSATQLAVSTLSDEVRIAGGGVTRVYGVAPDAQQAIILAGHSGNCALWINSENGNWASSHYYRDVPQSIGTRNRLEPLALRLDTMSWTPMRGAEAYSSLPEHVTHYPFRHTFSRGSAHVFDRFKTSAMGNREVLDMASRLIDEQNLGQNEGLDMLNIAFSVKPYDYTTSDDNRYELIDSYLRLDSNLEQLFTKLDGKLGAKSVLYFVAATPPSGRSRRDDEKWSIPYGEFSTKKAKSLLNMYLMATYGNGDWINSYHDGQFYLNHKLIGQLNLEPDRVRTAAAQFLAKMSGVDHVYTLDEILAGRGNARLEALQRNSHPSTSGDLFVEVDPGWEVVDDITSPAREDRVHYVKRLATATAPVFIMAPAVDPRVIDTPVDIRVVAPTVARLLRIRSPNGAALPSMVL